MSHYKMVLEVYIQDEVLTPRLGLELICKALAQIGCFAVYPLAVEFVKSDEQEPA